VLEIFPARQNFELIGLPSVKNGLKQRSTNHVSFFEKSCIFIKVSLSKAYDVFKKKYSKIQILDK
jgi:hypothetical protein